MSEGDGRKRAHLAVTLYSFSFPSAVRGLPAFCSDGAMSYVCSFAFQIGGVQLSLVAQLVYVGLWRIVADDGVGMVRRFANWLIGWLRNSLIS